MFCRTAQVGTFFGMGFCNGSGWFSSGFGWTFPLLLDGFPRISVIVKEWFCRKFIMMFQCLSVAFVVAVRVLDCICCFLDVLCWILYTAGFMDLMNFSGCGSFITSVFRVDSYSSGITSFGAFYVSSSVVSRLADR